MDKEDIEKGFLNSCKRSLELSDIFTNFDEFLIDVKRELSTSLKRDCLALSTDEVKSLCSKNKIYFKGDRVDKLISYKESLDKLNSDYELLESIKEQEYESDRIDLIRTLNLQKEKPIDAENMTLLFLDFFSLGAYPPPELYLAIVDVLNTYLEQKGSLKLENAFFGNKVSGYGDFAERRSKNKLVEAFDKSLFMSNAILFQEGKKPISKTKFAELYLVAQGYKTEDVDSFLKKYDRFKAKKTDN
jgi:hypothetical protein